MTKGKSTWKYNKLLTGRRNYFDGISGPSMMINQSTWYTPPESPKNNMGIVIGGYTNSPTVVNPGTSTISDIMSKIGTTFSTTLATTENNSGFLGLDWSNPFKGDKSSLKNAAFSAGINAAGSIGGGLISDGYSSTAGDVMSGLSNVVAAIPGPWGAVASSALKAGSGLANRAFGVKWNPENIAKVEQNIADLKNFQSNASDYDQLAANWSNATTGMTFKDSFIGKNGWFNNKATKKANSLRSQVAEGDAWVQNTLINNADTIANTQMNNMLGNYGAFGGPILFSNGGSIHIKPENKGKFTETKRRTGKTTEELTHSKNPLTRKRAIFAQNAKKWHHAFGGELNTQGGDFTNGLLYINNGDTHEANPYEGVQLGVDPEGTPNLVEEGETVFNDYVFSNRLMVPKYFKKKYKLGGNLTFAEASKKLSKESEERPNDPISMRGLEALMEDLTSTQEEIKSKKQDNTFANGGRVNKFAFGDQLWFLNEDILNEMKENSEKWLEQQLTPPPSNITTTNNQARVATTNRTPASNTNRGNQALNFDNSTPGLYFGLTSDQFNPYNANGTINFDVMYGDKSPFMDRRNFVLDNWNTKQVQNWLKKYVEAINKYNSSRPGYKPMTVGDITKDIFDQRTSDRNWGAMHAGIDLAGDPQERTVIEHMLRGDNGTLTELPEADRYYSDINFDTGMSWDEGPGKRLTRLNNGKAIEQYNPETHTRTIRYLYSPKEAAKENARVKKNRYYMWDKDSNTYKLVEGDNPLNTVMNSGYSMTEERANDLDGKDFYYKMDDPEPEFEKMPTWMRFMPTIGLGIASLTDTLGLTNKPNYADANAILEAARSAGTYQPVRYNPVGEYLTYKPFDRDYYTNKMNAGHNAALRLLSNTSGGNRATTMAGTIATDNNYLNKLGDLARQSEEYNLAQREKAATFNRGTDMANSEGALKAAMANREALMRSRYASFRGALAAAEMRQKERLASDAAKSSNISGFLTSLGDMGRENMAWNWRNFGLGTDTWADAGTNPNAYLLDNTGRKTNTTAKGGKIKRRKKGLTV